MIEKVQNRINKEVEKILEKEELTIPDYFFLEGIISRLKTEQSLKNYENNTTDMVNKLFDVFKTFKPEEKELCSKETLI